MRKPLIISSAIAALTFLPALALADTIIVEPEVDTWAMEQASPGVTVEGDVVVGTALPEDVQIMEVPKYQRYSFAVVNKHRVIVDTKSRKVVKIYK